MKKDEQEKPEEILQPIIVGEPEPEEKETPKKEVSEEGPSLKEIIAEQVTEEDEPLTANNLSLKKVLFGDILTAKIVRKQIWLVLLIAFFLMIYIAQRYSYQKYIVEIDALTDTLRECKYKALSSKSEITERTRQSKVLEMLKAKNDTTLKISNQPPFMVQVDDNE